MNEWKRSGQIPAFGDWEHANELPITQYFECARQAGLIRYSSSGECDQYTTHGGSYGGGGDFPGVGPRKASRELGPPRKTRGSRERSRAATHTSASHVKAGDVTEPASNPRHRQQQQPLFLNYYNQTQKPPKYPLRRPKAVDEDLYKIPPELLRTSKRKKMPGLFACLVPACAS